MTDNEAGIDDEIAPTFDWDDPRYDRRKAKEPRRQGIRRNADWRAWVRDILMIAMLVTIGLSTVAWVMGPVLGKRIADGTDEEVADHQRKIVELDSEKLVTRIQIKDLRTDVDALARQNTGSIYLLCAIYKNVQSGGIKPQLCANAKDVP